MKNKKKVLHILSSGSTGGIEIMMADFATYSTLENVFVFVWDEGPNAERIKSTGCTTYFIDCHRIGPINTIRKICKLSKVEHPDVIISHHGNGFIRLTAQCAKKICNIKSNIIYVHSNAHDQIRQEIGIKSFLMNCMSRYCFKKANGYIAISESVKNSLVDYLKIKPQKIRVIYNGVNLERFINCQHDLEDRIHFVFVGRLIKEKGVQIALSALSKLPDEIKWDFTVAGDGKYRVQLEQLAKSLGIDNKVFFLGTCHDIPSLLSKMDVFIHSCIWKEGFGIGLAEAMSAGKICIGSKIGAIPELIDDNKTGYLFEANNVESLANTILKAYNNEKEWKRIQQNAINKSQQYNLENYCRSLDSFLNEL